MEIRTWTIEDHLCRKCGGRILRCATGTGMSSGRESMYRCADCSASVFGMDSSKICWCGMQQKFHSFPAYQCLPYSMLIDSPELISNFLACGCDPSSGGEVGIVVKLL